MFARAGCGAHLGLRYYAWMKGGWVYLMTNKRNGTLIWA